MTTGAATRTVNPSRLAVSVAMTLILAVLLAQPAGATPNTGRKTIAVRVQAQREACETIGGGKLDVSNTYGSYTNGRPLISSTTTCKGGTQDGYTCVNTKTETNCSKKQAHAPQQSTQNVITEQPELAAVDESAGGSPLVESVAVVDEPAGDTLPLIDNVAVVDAPAGDPPAETNVAGQTDIVVVDETPDQNPRTVGRAVDASAPIATAADDQVDRP